MIVLDSSYALALVMPDETRPSSLMAVLRERLLTPFLWPLEIANAMRSAVRRGRLLPPEVTGLFAAVEAFDIEVVPPAHHLPQRHFETCRTHDLTPYDALYLDLALERRCALATRDAALAHAARHVGLTVHD